jgi:Xaa-Pro aminopeptidase
VVTEVPVTRTTWILALALFCSAELLTTDVSALQNCRQRAAAAFHGLLLVHAHSDTAFTADGFRQDPIFYYFTGLENTVGAVLAIEGKSGESWLFLPSEPPYAKLGLQPEVVPGPDVSKRLGIEHVVDWTELEAFLTLRSNAPLYYAAVPYTFPQMPANLVVQKSAPLWLNLILQKWPSFQAQEVTNRVHALLAVSNAEETLALRSAAKATVAAFLAGMRAIRPGVSQRSIEAAVESACWNVGAHGTSFWPWAMAGSNGVIEHALASSARYNYLNAAMRSGDLVRLDVGCEWGHYLGDFGRTVPVSGRYSDDQRETWNIFVAAYRAGVAARRDGVTVDQVFESWRAEMLRHSTSAKSPLAVDSHWLPVSR